ncbi:hypothetical protein Tco_1539038 [Tanacetum coccineum]
MCRSCCGEIATLWVPKKRRIETVIKQFGQSEGVEDDANSEETKDEDEIPLVHRQTGIVIGGQVHRESAEKILDHTSKLKGIEILSDAAQFELDIRRHPSDDDDKATEENVDDAQDKDEQARIEQPGNVQAKESFINDNPDVSLIDVLKELVEAEVQSLVDVLILQQKPADQQPPLVDTIVTLISEMTLKNVLPKDTLDFGKLRQEKAAKKSMPKYSTTQFDEDSLTKYDQKDKLLKMMMKSKRRDDKDQDPSTGSKKEKKKRKQKDYESSKKDKDQAGSLKKGKSPSKSSKTDKSVNAKYIVHDVEMDVGESVENDVVNAEYQSQADASATKQDKSTWFKTVVVERPESPYPKWHKEPTVDDAPEQSWFNDMVNTEKNQHTFDDVMVSVIDFTNFAKNFLKKDKITKADLEGLAFKLMKGGHNITTQEFSSTYFTMITIVRGNFSLYYITCIVNVSVCHVTYITKVDELTQPIYGNPIFIYVKQIS